MGNTCDNLSKLLDEANIGLCSLDRARLKRILGCCQFS
jgi:hypothetical protein